MSFHLLNFDRHQEAAKNYTYTQTKARVKRMRRLRKLVSYINLIYYVTMKDDNWKMMFLNRKHSQCLQLAIYVKIC